MTAPRRGPGGDGTALPGVGAAAGFDAALLQRASLRWYVNRLRAMEPQELPSRAAQSLGRWSSGLLHRLAGAIPEPRLRGVQPGPWVHAALRLPAVDPRPYVVVAQGLARGEIARLDGGLFRLGSPLDWAALPPQASRSDAPPSPAGAGADVCDALRVEMEVHRHGHLVRLAQAWRLDGQVRWRLALLEHLQGWIEHHPVGRGAAWASALDAGLRLLNWSIVWQLLGCHEDERAVPSLLRERWLRSVFEHARFIRAHRSRHSSANNHLMGELIGLLAARVTWPLWLEVVRWGDAAQRELHVQGLLQVHADGVGREQASGYQGFVFELLSALVLMDRALGHAPDERLTRRLAAMARFMAALRDAGGHVSDHGDADQAQGLSLGLPGEDPALRVLSLAVGLGVAPELAAFIPHPTPLAIWLFGDAALRPGPARTAEDPRDARRHLPRAFEAGGYYQLGRDLGGPDEVLMTLDAGDLGYLGIAAHGHADALALRLSVRGRPVLVDRGTFIYNELPHWRHYFRSTAAHNTVTLDGQDQSEYGGPFLWLRKASCRVLRFSSADLHGVFEAGHDGYTGLPGAPRLHRRVEWRGTARRFEVDDEIASAATHEVAIAWHFAPDCVVELRDGCAWVSAGPTRLRLRMAPPDAGGSPGPGHWRLHCGDPASLHGWHSPRFGVLQAAPTLIWHGRSSATVTFRTWIEIDPNEGGSQ